MEEKILMDFGMIAAISAVVGVVIAILALIKQSKDAHISLGIQLLHDLDKQFGGEEMKQFRRDIANLCIKREEGVEISAFEICQNASDVSNFFEKIGLFLKRDILDLEFTWNYYAMYSICYWEVLEKDINELRKLQNDNTPWEGFEYLYKQMKKHDRKLKIRTGKVPRDLIQLFLTSESQL